MTCPDENTLLAYCERRLAPPESSAVEAHLDTCADCLALVGEAARGDEPTTIKEGVKEEGRAGGRKRPGRRAGTGSAGTAPEEDTPRRGTVLGRYVVLDRLGAGGMGVVLSAYDPQLDRKVALKLVRSPDPDAPEELEQRLLREAQAVARLSHPHVITVFDVGAVDGRLFMAMEFVEGVTLRQWLKGRPRSWREVLDVFRQAGQGLAAAHAAGLVHRDFKPDNVLVDKRDRARVTDFGLARWQEMARAPVLPEETPGDEPREEALTRTGALLGTPAYMAPEQWRGEPADARCDQFSFCVALYEALFGVRPFARGRPPDFQRVQPPTRESRAPARLRRVLLRGLSEAPEARYRSLDVLLARLARESSRRQRVGAVAGLAALGGLLVGGLVLGTRGPDCSGGPGRTARVWNEARRAQVRAALLATGSPLAAATADAVERGLGDYVRAWEAGYTETCAATHVRHEQPESVLAPRMACLDARLASLDILADVLAHADEALVQKAAEAARQLPRVSDCARVESILAVVPPPEGPEAEARLKDARARLARARVLLDTGRYAEGLPEAQATRETARALRYRPLEAEALHAVGWLEYRLGQAEEAARDWKEGLHAALAGRHDDLALACATELVFVTGYELQEGARSREWADEARALLERSGPTREVEARLEHNQGVVRFAEGRFDEAMAHYRRALAIRERVLGVDHLETGKALSNIALVHQRQGHATEAVPLYERVLAIQRAQLGAEHPAVATTLLLLADARRALEGGRATLPLYHQALEMRRRTLGEAHPSTLRLYYDIGFVHEVLGDYAEARRQNLQALEVSARAYGEDHAEYALALENVARVDALAGDLDGALAGYARVRALRERLLGPQDITTLEVRTARAGVLRQAGRSRESADELERVLVDMKALGEERLADCVPPLLELARTRLELRQADAAHAALERAFAIIQPLGWGAAQRAELQFELARTLWLRGERPRAVSLADEAHAALTRSGESWGDTARAVEQWRRAHAHP